jgi:glycosyltransferase involved in cell wall biosynthesis
VAVLLRPDQKELYMRIAQVAPLFESVPPKLYGGTERVVSYLTEELVRQGHDVTLFASGDSLTEARLVAPCPRSLRLDESCVDQFAHHIVMLDEVFRRRSRFDIIHFHIDYVHFPLSRCYRELHLTTLHGRLDLPDLPALYRHYQDMPVISISDAQRAPLSWINWQATVYHGLPLNLFRFHEKPGQYLAFLGRVSPEKGLDQAIEIAKRVGIPLRIAAKMDRNDWRYFKETIEPLLNHPLIDYIGEIGDNDKNDFLGNARALLFPINWPEPFGLVMIESMACGTPVIAYPCGSVREVMTDGVSGFIVRNVDEAVGAVERIGALSRRRCREYFETRFSAPRMAREYVSLYQRMLQTMSSRRTFSPWHAASRKAGSPRRAGVPEKYQPTSG